MNIAKLIPVLFAAAIALSPPVKAQPPVAPDLATAAKEVEAQEALYSKAGSETARAPFYDEKVLNMHTSGWLYNKADDFALMNGNSTTTLGGSRPFKSDTTERKVVPYSRNMVAVVWKQTMYYPVPDPEDLAEAQGIKTLDAAAVAKARANLPPGPLPGERYAPNPYRARYMRIWLRDPASGKWLIAVAAASKITARTLPGRYPLVGLGSDSEIDR